MKLSDFHPGCHGIPERCFKAQGKAMPFCARCFGASAGHISGITLYALSYSIKGYYLLLALTIMLADWIFQNKLRLYHSNIARFSTGLLGGLAVSILIFSIAKRILQSFY